MDKCAIHCLNKAPIKSEHLRLCIPPHNTEQHQVNTEQPARLAMGDWGLDLAQHPGKLDALLFAAGEFLVETALEAVKVDGAQRLCHGRAVIVAVGAA